MAARNFAALYRGEDSIAADVAGERLAYACECVIAFVEAHDSNKQPKPAPRGTRRV